MSWSDPVRFPGESAAYRKAREELLASELELRRKVEEVAAQRRRLPPGGELREDFSFIEGARDLADTTHTNRTRVSELFTPGKDTLMLYSFMYGPEMERPCPLCTSILDSLDGATVHVNQRVNLAVVAKSPITRIREFARERGWRRLRLLSSEGTTYNHDYRGEIEGKQMPSLNVFVRREAKIHHWYNSEVLFAPTEPGQGTRHVDPVWPLWNLFDFTPDGRGDAWHPQLEY